MNTAIAKQIKLHSGKKYDLVFIPTVGSEEELSEAAYLATLSDHSTLAHAIFSGALEGTHFKVCLPKDCELVRPDRLTRLSGVNLPERWLRKGPLEAIENWIGETGGMIHNQTRRIVDQIIRRGHKAIVVADEMQDLGVVEISPAL